MDVASANIRDLARWSMSTGRGRWVGELMKRLQPADSDDLMQEIMFVMWRYREKALTKTCPILYLATKTSYKAKRFLKTVPLVRDAEVCLLRRSYPDTTTRTTAPDLWDWVPDEVKDFYYGESTPSREEAKRLGVCKATVNNRRRAQREKVLDCLRRDPVFTDTYA